MNRLLFFIFCFVIFIANAKEVKQDENINVFGTEVISKNDTILIIKNGVLIKDNAILSADTIIYNKLKKSLDAEGNVYINYQNSFINGKQVYIDLTKKSLEVTPFFMLNYDDFTWISGKKLFKKEESYKIKNMITSTCSPNSPDWKIVASSSKYNKKTKWVQLYNPTLYIKDVPVFYLPYLSFSTDKTRRSGFLRPIFGISGSEGILFSLPYYQIFGDVADLEIEPTIRKKRGKGIYSTFRFVHSPTSYGEFKIGKFKDKKEFQERYNLENRIHRGWSFLYKNRDLFYNDKLYMKLKNANDTDYFYLSPENRFNTTYLTDKIITSKLNYYSIYKDNYFGVYGRYFKDTTKNDNSDTMQLLPQFQYHKFTTTLLDKFLYSIDFNTYNYTRKTGYKAVKNSIFIPFSYQLDMFDNYLKFNIKESFNYSQVNEKGDNTDFIAKYYTNNTNLKLYSLLSKKYKNFSHSIVPSISFLFNNKYHKNGYESEYLETSKVRKNLKLSLAQYLSSENLSLYHSLSQIYYLDKDENKKRLSDLYNVLDVNYYDFYLKERNVYSYNIAQIKYNASTLGYKNDLYKLETKYIFNYNESESIDLNGYYKLDEHHKLFADYDYDLKFKMQKYWLLGIAMNKRCWNYKLSFKREINPILTSGGVSGIIRKTIYFEVEFIPLGGVSQQYQFKTEKRSLQ